MSDTPVIRLSLQNLKVCNLTLRDTFAMAALPVVLETHTAATGDTDQGFASGVARKSYFIADAMLAEREAE